MNNLKKTLALVATLAMASTAFVGCGSKDSSSDSAPAATTAAPTDAATTEAAATDAETTTDAETPTDAPSGGNSTDLGEITLKTGGDTKFTLAAWNSDDAPALLEQWEKNTGVSADQVNFINMDCQGGDASAKYDNMFKSGDDLDLYFVEADWALKYINDDTKTAPLEALGFTDDNFKDAYAYTLEIGRATKGGNAGKMVGASWQCAAGGFAYRTDLAEQYLGIKTPEEMQAKIQGWDNFVATATEVAEATGGKVAFADTLGGMWQVFAANRTTPWVVDGALMIDDSCKTFADYAKTLWDNGGVTHNTQWSDAWIPSGKDGSCMGFFVSTWGFGEKAFFGQACENSYGKWAVCEGPDKYFWGGTWLVVNPATDNADLAQTFIYNATVDQNAMKEFALSKPEYVNNQTAMNEIIDAKEVPNQWVTDNLGGQNYFEALNENAKSIDIKGLITPYDATVKAKFLDAVTNNYCTNGESWEDTQKAAMSAVLAEVGSFE